MKVLIAFDGSISAAAALDDLERAGLPAATDAVLLSVAEVWQPPVAEPAGHLASKLTDMIRARNEEARALAAQAVEVARVEAEAGAARVRAAHPRWTVRAEAASGLPGWEIIKRADQWQPDLIVVGSQGRSMVERALLGSVSQMVLNEARCSVRVARRRAAAADQRNAVHVLIAVDGSADATAAAAAMAARDWPTETKFRLIASDDPFGPDLQTMRESESEETRNWIEQVLTTPARPLRAAGLAVSETMRWGDAAHAIVAEAEAWQADCIVLGARGHGMWHRLLLGSVSAVVAKRARCSVEVVRPGHVR